MTDAADTALIASLQGARLQGRGPRAYQIGPLLGEGSQALVFVAADDANQPLALKVFRPSFVRGSPVEARLVAQKEWMALNHLRARGPCPNLVGLLDLGSWSHAGVDLPWLALERVDGGSLKASVAASLARSNLAFSPRRALRVLGGVVAGLDVVHRAGVIHRDLKPSNVLLTGLPPNESARIADLGISRSLGLAPTFAAGASLGAPGYVAPEVSDPRRTSFLADVFSLGALTYFVLTGHDMFGGSMHAAMAAIQLGTSIPLAARASLHPLLTVDKLADRIYPCLRKATHKDASQRYMDAMAFWKDVGPLIGHAARPELNDDLEDRGPSRPTPATASSRTTHAFHIEPPYADEDDP